MKMIWERGDRVCFERDLAKRIHTVAEFNVATLNVRLEGLDSWYSTYMFVAAPDVPSTKWDELFPYIKELIDDHRSQSPKSETITYACKQCGCIWKRETIFATSLR